MRVERVERVERGDSGFPFVRAGSRVVYRVFFLMQCTTAAPGESSRSVPPAAALLMRYARDPA